MSVGGYNLSPVTGGCEHCWHHTGRMFMSDPPQAVDQCCHCGKTRHRVDPPTNPSGHGPYKP